jgi:hypothetical protein
MAGGDGVSGRGGKVAGKTQGEGKALKSGERGWQSGVGSANYLDLRDIGGRSFGISAIDPLAQAFPTPALRKVREGRGTRCMIDASEIKSLGHPSEPGMRISCGHFTTQWRLARRCWRGSRSRVPRLVPIPSVPAFAPAFAPKGNSILRRGKQKGPRKLIWRTGGGCIMLEWVSVTEEFS